MHEYRKVLEPYFEKFQVLWQYEMLVLLSLGVKPQQTSFWSTIWHSSNV